MPTTNEAIIEEFKEKLGFEEYSTNGSAVFLHTGKNESHFLKAYPKSVEDFLKKALETKDKEAQERLREVIEGMPTQGYLYLGGRIEEYKKSAIAKHLT